MNIKGLTVIKKGSAASPRRQGTSTERVRESGTEEALNIKNFAVIRKGSALCKKAKELYEKELST